MSQDWASLVASCRGLRWENYAVIAPDAVFAGGGVAGSVDVSAVPVLAAIAATKLKWGATPIPAALLTPPRGIDVKGYNKLAVEVRHGPRGPLGEGGGGAGSCATLSTPPRVPQPQLNRLVLSLTGEKSAGTAGVMSKMESLHGLLKPDAPAPGAAIVGVSPLVPELYFQLLRHLTSNARPDSELLGWRLLVYAVATFRLPDADSLRHVVAFLLSEVERAERVQATALEHTGAGGVAATTLLYARWCLRGLELLHRDPLPWVPLRPTRLASYLAFDPLLVDLLFPDGSYVVADLPLRSAETGDEFTQRALQHAGLPLQEAARVRAQWRIMQRAMAPAAGGGDDDDSRDDLSEITLGTQRQRTRLDSEHSHGRAGRAGGGGSDDDATVTHSVAAAARSAHGAARAPASHLLHGAAGTASPSSPPAAGRSRATTRGDASPALPSHTPASSRGGGGGVASLARGISDGDTSGVQVAAVDPVLVVAGTNVSFPVDTYLRPSDMLQPQLRGHELTEVERAVVEADAVGAAKADITIINLLNSVKRARVGGGFAVAAGGATVGLPVTLALRQRCYYHPDLPPLPHLTMVSPFQVGAAPATPATAPATARSLSPPRTAPAPPDGPRPTAPHPSFGHVVVYGTKCNRAAGVAAPALFGAVALATARGGVGGSAATGPSAGGLTGQPSRAMVKGASSTAALKSPTQSFLQRVGTALGMKASARTGSDGLAEDSPSGGRSAGGLRTTSMGVGFGVGSATAPTPLASPGSVEGDVRVGSDASAFGDGVVAPWNPLVDTEPLSSWLTTGTELVPSPSLRSKTLMFCQAISDLMQGVICLPRLEAPDGGPPALPHALEGWVIRALGRVLPASVMAVTGAVALIADGRAAAYDAIVNGENDLLDELVPPYLDASSFAASGGTAGGGRSSLSELVYALLRDASVRSKLLRAGADPDEQSFLLDLVLSPLHKQPLFASHRFLVEVHAELWWPPAAGSPDPVISAAAHTDMLKRIAEAVERTNVSFANLFDPTAPTTSAVDTRAGRILVNGNWVKLPPGAARFTPTTVAKVKRTEAPKAVFAVSASGMHLCDITSPVGSALATAHADEDLMPVRPRTPCDRGQL